MDRRCAVLLIPLIGSLAAILFVTLLAQARDLDGRYANSPLKPWFDQLKSGRGLCCSHVDGYVVEEVNWELRTAIIECAFRKTPPPLKCCESMCQSMP